MSKQVMEFEQLLADQETERLKKAYDKAEATLAHEQHKYDLQHEIVREKSKEEEFMIQYKEAVGNVCQAIELVSDPAEVLANQTRQASERLQKQAEERRAREAAAASQSGLPMAGLPTAGLPVDDDEGGDGGTGGSMLGAGQLGGQLAAAGLPVPKAPPALQGGLGLPPAPQHHPKAPGAP